MATPAELRSRITELLEEVEAIDRVYQLGQVSKSLRDHYMNAKRHLALAAFADLALQEGTHHHGHNQHHRITRPSDHSHSLDWPGNLLFEDGANDVA